MYNIEIHPGCMGTVRHAVDLFGSRRVEPGEWMLPVKVLDLTYDEVEFAVEFFAEHGKRVATVDVTEWERENLNRLHNEIDRAIYLTSGTGK